MQEIRGEFFSCITRGQHQSLVALNTNTNKKYKYKVAKNWNPKSCVKTGGKISNIKMSHAVQQAMYSSEYYNPSHYNNYYNGGNFSYVYHVNNYYGGS